jgi:hypothetical protein
MADATSLLDRLDAADDDARELVWASDSTLLTPEDLRDAARQSRPCLPWLVLRYDAGPPGRALPDALKARSSLLRGKGAAAEAYAAMFTGPAVTDTAEALPLLLNATAAVLIGPIGWLGGWLAARAALACIAAGQPDRAWELLDALTKDGRRHPEMEKVALFLPLRNHPALATCALVRAAVCWLWPQLRVPAVPALPWPSRGADDLAATLERLAEVGAGEVCRLTLAFLRAVEEAREDDHSADPLVKEIERRALAGEGPPAVGSLPEWFPDWALAQGQDERLAVAYLAGQLLHAHAHPDKALVAMLIWRVARTGDVPVLRSCVEESELVALLSELEDAAARLSPRLGEALVALALPNHAGSTRAIGVLLAEADALDVLRPQPGGVVAHVVGMVHEIAESRAREHAEARPLVEVLWAEVRGVADRLGDVRQLSVADVERATRGIAAPPISLGVLELSQDNDLPPLGRLLQALVFLHAVVGSSHEPTWGPALRKDASTAIWHLGVVRLFELRIRLLDELIAAPGPLASLAELHFQRANSRRALQVYGDGVSADVADDLVTAIEHARRAGELEFLADAVGMWARVLADGPAEAQDSRQLDVVGQVDELLALPLRPGRRASLLQAKAHLVRRRDSALAARLMEDAVAFLDTSDPYRWEIGAEYVIAQVDAGRVTEAVAQGRRLLGEVTERATDSVIAMAHHALGYAFEHQGAWGEARREYDRALDRVRGVDWRNEAATRLRLARIALALGDEELWRQQHQVLDERARDLGAVMLSDLAQLTAEAAHRRIFPQEEATAYLVTAESRSPAAAGAGALATLQRARLGLDSGEEVDLGGVIHSAVESAGSNVDAVLEPILDLACNHGDLLEVPLLRTLATLARERRRPAAEARLLDHLGEAAAACAVLEGALATDLPKAERAACTHLLVTLLGDDRTEDRLVRCQELEGLLAENDSPTARIDLASCYRLMARGDRQLLERAWVHGTNALPGLRAGTERSHGHRVVALIVTDLVHAGIGRADSEVAERARWLLDELPIPAKDLAEIRHAVAHNLLVLGPLCSPATVDVAVRLLALAAAGEHAPAGVQALQERASWIQDVTAAQPTGRPRPLEGPGGPTDGLPTWLIRLVAGHRERPDGLDLAAGLDDVALAVRVRPDAADRVLSTLVRRQGMLSEKARAALFELVLREVSGPTIGDGAWAELEVALQSLKSKNQPRHATAIEGEIQRARGGAPRAPAVEPPARAPGSAEYARSAFGRAVTLMRSVKAEPFAEDAAPRIHEARQLLADAVAISSRKNMSEESDFLISLGNAWKMPPDEDVDRALAIYEMVGRRQLHASQIAKLQKVRGDALRRRGRPEDLREAFDLLRKSARARVGWEKAESLRNAAYVAQQHPDFDDLQRIVRAAELMLDAARADASHVEDALEDLLMLLGKWGARAPTDERPNAIREELRRRYPGRSSDIDVPAWRPPPWLREHVFAMLTHPAGRAYGAIESKLMDAEQAARDPLGLRRRLGKAAKEKIEAELTRKSLLGDPDGITLALAKLDADTHDVAAAPGVALARVRLLAELCRAGRKNLDAVQEASRTAQAEIDCLAEPIVRAFLTREHARIWCPHDHSGDAVRDFALSAELARDAMALEGGEAQATTDTLELVARALRYSPTGDIGANLAECRRLYGLLVERARAEGDAALAANAMHCLADAESQGADGDGLSRLRAAEARIETAVRSASNPYKRALYMSSLAWQRTQSAFRLPVHEQVEALRSALASFDEVDRAFLDEKHLRQNHRLNRSACYGALERVTKGRRAEVEFWRTELKAAEGEGHAHLVAAMQHNLANALVIGSDVGPREIAEVLDLCERAATVRTLEANARHHWETTLLAGMGLSQALAAAIELPWSPPLTWEKTRGWLRRAVEAARALGAGEELAAAASELARLARLTPSTRDAIEVAEEGWSAMREAMPYLLFHPDTALQESMGALDLALGLGWSLARQGLWVAPPGIAFVMDGERARLVLRWLLRGFAPLRRPLTARLQRPPNVGQDLWTTWQGALDAQDRVALARVLKTVRAAAPGFLGADLTLAPTWRWLRGRPGAVAITIILAQPVSLAVVLSVEGGRERVQVLGVPAPPSPVNDEVLWGALSQSSSLDSDGSALHDTAAEWARKELVDPILRYLGTPPAAVLWCPGQTLRMVSPAAIWGRTPVATAAALALPDLASAPPRGRSTLVVLADPGKEPLGLDGGGKPAAQRLVDTASSRGDTSALVSVGEKYGPSLGVARTVKGPASPANLLGRARDHDVLVIVAHGEAQTPESAALLLLDETGEVQRLDVAGLAAHPGAFTGATVILLACESGRVGAGFHEPGGVAGALVAAGAKAVIAPLWPVRLDVAEAVAEAVLRGVAAGEEPFEVLARVQAGGDGRGVMLGPAPALNVQNGAAARHRQAFVTWVG